MEQKRKVLTIGLGIIGGLAVIGFVIGTFLDQKIATSLGNYDSVFGILFTLLAPVLSLAVGEVAGAMLFFMPKIENKTWDVIFRVIGAVTFVAFSVFAIKEGKEYVEFPVMEENRVVYKVLAITLVVLIDLAIILGVKATMRYVDPKKIIPTVLTVFAIIASWVLISEVIKHIASRPRPRNVYLEQIVEYRNWFQIRPFLCFKNGFEDCKSFVSGHTFIAACLIGAVPLIASVGKNGASIKTIIVGLVIAGLFTFAVAFSRVIAYAHFMSDVMGAIIASCGAQIVIVNVAPLIYEKALKSKQINEK